MVFVLFRSSREKDAAYKVWPKLAHTLLAALTEIVSLLIYTTLDCYTHTHTFPYLVEPRASSMFKLIVSGLELDRGPLGGAAGLILSSSQGVREAVKRAATTVASVVFSLEWGEQSARQLIIWPVARTF